MIDSFFSSRSRGETQAAFLTTRDCAPVLAYLEQSAHLNLQLIDLVHSVARVEAAPADAPLVVVAWSEEKVVGVVSLRPSLILDSDLSPAVLGVFLPFLDPLESGLLKSAESVVTPLWEMMRARNRRALIDRYEIGFWLRPGCEGEVAMPAGTGLRRADSGDLDALVRAARDSLREEGRPDPSHQDPEGFRRWVSSRLHRARVVEVGGKVGFVGYADVQRSEGWLVQGVFTWPDMRRRGLARAGMSGLIAEAFAAGAEHVQLTVVEGNSPAVALYRSLGFESYTRLRTILFQ